LARLRESVPFQMLAQSRKRKDTKAATIEITKSKKMQEAILSALKRLAPKGVVKNRRTFAELLKAGFRTAGAKASTPLFKTVLDALSERDGTADVCADEKGNPEPDPELRDYENVPLKEDVAEYVRREVLPHVPNAWIDESKTKVGYEINFNRYFYKYTPLRLLPDIETDLKQTEKEIAEMLAKMTE